MLLTFRNNPKRRKRTKPLQQQKMIEFQGKISKFLSEVDFFVFGFWDSFWSFSQLRRSYVFRFLEFFAFETLFRILVSILGNLMWNSGFWSHLLLIRLGGEWTTGYRQERPKSNRRPLQTISRHQVTQMLSETVFRSFIRSISWEEIEFQHSAMISQLKIARTIIF